MGKHKDITGFPQGSGWPKERAQEYADAINSHAALTERVRVLTKLLEGLLDFGIEFDDERLSYVVAHVERDAIDAARAALAAETGGQDDKCDNAAPAAKPYMQHLYKRLRTEEDITGYLLAAPDEGSFRLAVKDVIAALNAAPAEAGGANTLDDGFGNTWSVICPECKQPTMEIVRPGKVQCGAC